MTMTLIPAQRWSWCPANHNPVRPTYVSVRPSACPAEAPSGAKAGRLLTPGLPTHRLHRQPVTGVQRLLRVDQQIEDVSLPRAQEERLAVRHQPQIAGVVERL